jgi:hypothetical protein
MTELNEKIKDKLAEAVEIWADDNLVGKPTILANAIYISLEQTFIKQIEEIKKRF